MIGQQNKCKKCYYIFALFSIESFKQDNITQDALCAFIMLINSYDGVPLLLSFFYLYSDIWEFIYSSWKDIFTCFHDSLMGNKYITFKTKTQI